MTKIILNKPVSLPTSAKTMRLAGLISPLILTAYFIFIKLGYLKIDLGVPDKIPIALLAIWLITGLVQFIKPSVSNKEVALRLFIYHVIAGIIFIIFNTFPTPLIALWVLLITASYIYFSTVGVMLSIFSFISVLFIDTVFWHRLKTATTVTNLLLFMGVLITTIIILSAFHRIKKIAQEALEKSKAQEMLQKDRTLAIVNNMADALISTDEKGNINVYNAACLDLLNTNKTLNGHNIREVLKLKDDEGKEVDILDSLLIAKKVSRRDDLNYKLSDNESIKLELTYAPIRSGYKKPDNTEAQDGYILILRDITREKSLEEERDEFIGVVSHELRTPLTIAEGTISNVQAMIEHPDSAKTSLKDAVKIAHDQVIFLANIVNDLSTLSRAERGVGNDSEEIDVHDLIDTLVEKYSKEVKEKHLALHVDLDKNVNKIAVSRLYIEELLQNFMTNAIKYTLKGSITIIVKQKNNIITFAVKDTGLGISDEEQSKIFDKFYRSEDIRLNEINGTGLGLYISAKLARKLNTKIEIDSKLNVGSTFSFALPSNLIIK